MIGSNTSPPVSLHLLSVELYVLSWDFVNTEKNVACQLVSQGLRITCAVGVEMHLCRSGMQTCTTYMSFCEGGGGGSDIYL